MNLSSVLNVSNRVAVIESNFQEIDRRNLDLPSIDPSTGIETVDPGPPTGTAAAERVVGERWLDVNLALWRCTVAGNPGTWIQVAPAVVAADPVGIPNDYVIARTVEWLKLYYWDGAVWTAV
jgi:hypothetical protein